MTKERWKYEKQESCITHHLHVPCTWYKCCDCSYMQRAWPFCHRNMRRGKILVESQTGEAPTLHFQANIKTGLSAAQVEAQRDAGNINTAVAPPTKTISAIIKENLFTYFNLVFIILAVLVMAAGSFRSLTFMPVVIANALIGIFQELRAKQALDKLRLPWCANRKLQKQCRSW